MRIVYERLIAGADEGIACNRIRTRSFHCPWHAHPEHELILTLHCPGYRMVGDDISPLRPGDLVLVGAHLPHLWHADAQPARDRQPVQILVAQFESDALGRDFLQLPALYPVRRLLQQAALGLQFTGPTRDRAAILLDTMTRVAGLRRVALFVELLALLAQARDARPIAGPGFSAQPDPFIEERMTRVLRHVHARIDQPLRLAELARVAHMSEGAFSRFFHRHAGRTFPAFLNRLRVGRACRMLVETDSAVTEIALACGYANLSNFNRQFLRLKGVAPREFRRQAMRTGL